MTEMFGVFSNMILYLFGCSSGFFQNISKWLQATHAGRQTS